METSHSAPHGVYEAVHGPDPYTPEEFARDYGVPLEAVREALDYVANNLPLAWIPMQKKKPDRHGFWGGRRLRRFSRGAEVSVSKSELLVAE
jgi:hypothetical protein